MDKISMKSVIRRAFWRLNFRNMVRLNTSWLFARRNRTFFIFEGTHYTYGEVYKQSSRYAQYFLSERKKAIEAGKLGKGEKLAVGIYMENTPEFIFAAFGAGLSNSVLFAINTGFRGDVLVRVVEKSKATHLIINQSSVEEIKRVKQIAPVFERINTLYVGGEDEAGEQGFTSLGAAVSEAERKGGNSLLSGSTISVRFW